jgi:hypothetical protein
MECLLGTVIGMMCVRQDAVGASSISAGRLVPLERMCMQSKERHVVNLLAGCGGKEIVLKCPQSFCTTRFCRRGSCAGFSRHERRGVRHIEFSYELFKTPDLLDHLGNPLSGRLVEGVLRFGLSRCPMALVGLGRANNEARGISASTPNEDLVATDVSHPRPERRPV